MHVTNLDYFFLIHFLTCYLEPVFPQSNGWFKEKLTFIIFESFFSSLSFYFASWSSL